VSGPEFTEVAVFYRGEDGAKRYVDFIPRVRGEGVFLDENQAEELREFLRRIVGHRDIFSVAHDIYDDAHVFQGWLR